MKHITVPILQLDVPNKNGRVYPTSAAEDMIRTIEENPAQHGRVFGQIGMPEGTSVDLSKVSHSAGNLRIIDGKVFADIVVLETPAGQIAKELLKTPNHGYTFRTSGIGKVSEDGVVFDYCLISVSLVRDGA